MNVLNIELMNPERQKGSTLVELMISVTIGLFILGVIITIMLNAYKSNEINSGLLYVQENAQFALDTLSKDIRQSGYLGCAQDTNPLDATAPITSKSTSTLLGAFSIEGFEYKEAPGSDEETGKASLYSDALFLQYATLVAPLITDMASPMSSIHVGFSGRNASQKTLLDKIKTGSLMVVGDCQSADIFTVTARTILSDTENNQTIYVYEHRGSDGKNTSDAMRASYNQNANLYSLNTVRYYIADDSTNLDNDNTAIPTLYRAYRGTAEALIPGVDVFQILYGLDMDHDGNPNSYVRADEVTNWNQIYMVKIGILMRTENSFGSDFQRNTVFPIKVLDFEFQDDGKKVRRRLFETVIQLRNIISS